MVEISVAYRLRKSTTKPRSSSVKDALEHRPTPHVVSSAPKGRQCRLVSSRPAMISQTGRGAVERSGKERNKKHCKNCSSKETWSCFSPALPRAYKISCGSKHGTKTSSSLSESTTLMATWREHADDVLVTSTFL